MLGLLGYISNWTSVASSERRAAHVAVLPARAHWQRPFRLDESDEDSPRVAARLEGIGEDHVLLSSGEIGEAPFPYGRVGQAESVAPFVHRVSYGSFFGDLGATGGDVYVVTFFGRSLYVRRVPRWVS